MERKHYSYSGMSGWEEDAERATRDSWNFKAMPELRVETSFERSFSEEELRNLEWGHISRDMDDRWCFYVEDGWAHIHRSWTGLCMYILELGPGPVHRVIVNQDPEQFTGSVEEALNILDTILDRWCPTHVED